MPVKNAYTVTLKVEEYLKRGGTMDRLLEVLKLKRVDRVEGLIAKQSWKKKHVEALVTGFIISFAKRVGPRKNINRAEEITTQVLAFVEELSNTAKICKLLGWESRVTYNNRIKKHNWTEQEKALLIHKRILDDTF